MYAICYVIKAEAEVYGYRFEVEGPWGEGSGTTHVANLFYCRKSCSGYVVLWQRRMRDVNIGGGGLWSMTEVFKALFMTCVKKSCE